MNELLHRTKSGKARVGESWFKVPKGISAVAVMFGPTPPNKMEELREDWYYHYKGKRRRCLSRETSGGSSVLIWVPHLKEIARIERAYWWATLRLERRFKIWRRLCNKIKSHGKVGAWAKSPEGWRHYTVSTCDGVGYAYVKKAKPKNTALGHEFEEAQNAHDRALSLHLRMRDLLSRACISSLENPERAEKQYRFIINGRNYWFHSMYDNHGMVVIVPLNFSEEAPEEHAYSNL